MIEKKLIAKGFVALVCLAAVFLTGLHFGRIGGAGDFTVTTQYAVGAMDSEELDEIVRRVEERAKRQTAEGSSQAVSNGEEISDDRGLININTASVDELTALPGVGPSIAERIVSHRGEHGPFRIIEEITDVSGIGERRFEDIRDMITVGSD